jgi:septation ring formation regulator EzrA
MDADIKEEFTSVRAEFASVHAQFAAVREEFAAVREEFAAVRGEMRGSEATLRQEIREEGISTRRHFDIIAESLRDDIRIIAEGLIALDTKVERMRQST